MEESVARTLKKVLSLPPYHYIVELLHRLKYKEYDKEKYSEQDIYLLKKLLDNFSKDLDKDINEKLRLIEIEKDLIKLVENTDNKIFYRKLFFPSVFINNQFNFENWIIKGILVEEVFTKPDDNIYVSTKDMGIFNDYIIFVSAIDPNTAMFWNSSFSLINKNVISLIDIEINKDKDQKRRIEEYIRTIICNLVDMVDGNDEDLNVISIETKIEQNLKRIDRGKIPFPTKIYIRGKGEFKKYVNNFNIEAIDAERKLSYKFLVRGHWRHFRSEKFINKKGEKTWIKPFYKGEGIIVAKEYKLIKDEVNLI
jgi:hypothetical protein